MLSIILPSYNEEGMIREAAQVVERIMREEDIPFELIFVNDGSSDGTWSEILKAKEDYSFVRGVSFSRNFGKEAAVFAGLSSAKGDCAAVMDCDLQHPPETLVTMYRLWEDGYQIVEGVKASRGKEGFFYKLFAKTFYKIISHSTGVDMTRASDFKLLDRQAIDEFIALPERNVFFRALSSWIGFKTTYVEFDVREREYGKSKWSARKLFKYAISSITSFSTAPMQIVSFCGGIFFLFAVVLAVQSLYQFFAGIAVAGFTTVILLLLMIGSVLMMSLGVIGYYISKIYEEIKMRPRYIISETTEEEQLKDRETR